jgi:abhydrolase domain-containing protein 17
LADQWSADGLDPAPASVSAGFDADLRPGRIAAGRKEPISAAINVLLSLLKVLIVALGLAYLGLAAMALFLTPRLLFPVPPPGYVAGPDFPFLTLPDGTRIATAYLPAPRAPVVILYHHGNGEDLGHARGRLMQLRQRGYSVFAYDYPGYGRSEGRPSERSLLAAAEAAYHHLVEVEGWDPENIVHYGHSLGGGPALALAARHPSRAVIVEGTFTSVFRVLTHVRLLPWDLFDNLQAARQLPVPLLVLHGQSDLTVPPWHGTALAAAAPRGRLFPVPEAHHVNLWETAGASLWDEIASFIADSQDADSLPADTP